MKLIFIFFLLISSTLADVVEIKGILDHGNNPEVFSSIPIDGVLKVEIDYSAIDENSSPLIGEYEMPNARIKFRVGNTIFETIGVEWKVYAGEDDFYGVSVGNLNAYTQNEHELIEYFGNYGSLLSPFQQTATYFPNDSLFNITQESLESALSNAYFYVQDTQGNRIQGDISSITIPEPNILNLFLIGFLVCYKLKR